MCCLERELIGKHKMNMLSIFDLAIVKNNNCENAHNHTANHGHILPPHSTIILVLLVDCNLYRLSSDLTVS